MLCDFCGKREATVHITQVAGGKKTEMHLCPECAKQLGGEKEGSFITLSLPKLISSVFVGDEWKGFARKVPSPRSCERCGMTMEEFGKVGKFGCSNCYRTFRGAISNVLRQVHGSTRHVGRRPRCLASEMFDVNSELDELSRLKEELKRAVESEDYERAAQIRDRIKALESPRC